MTPRRFALMVAALAASSSLRGLASSGTGPGVDAASVSASSTPGDPFQPLDASKLFALGDADPAPTAIVRAEYERFLLSRTRSTPFVLYFLDSSDCSGIVGADNVKDEEDWAWPDWEDQAPEPPQVVAAREACLAHNNLVNAAVERAAGSLSTPQHPIVRVDSRDMPAVLHYHLVSATPSLLWIPIRSSAQFQRYPHAETNFLDLDANSSLFEAAKATWSHMEEESTTEDARKLVTSETLAGDIAAFVEQCHMRSGYATANKRGKGGRHGKQLPAVSTPAQMPAHAPAQADPFSLLGLLPVLVMLVFVAVVVNENRDFVLRVVRTRLCWFSLCMAVIYVALSGLFHSIILHRAMYYFSRQHGFVFVYPSSRRQFVLEGLLHGTWSFWLSLAAMSLTDVLPTLRSRLARQEVIRWSLLLVVVSYMMLHIVFLLKYRWLA